MTATALPRYGSTSTAHCRPCGSIKPFSFSGFQNGRGPRVDLWTCRPTGHTRMQMADLTDAEGLAKTILDRAAAGKGDSFNNPLLSYDDALGIVMAELYDLWTVWDPSRGVRFTAYATGLLRLRVNNVWRTLGKRSPEDRDVREVSYDALLEGGGLGGAVGSSAGDPSIDRGTGLGRALSQGDRPALQRLPPGDRSLAAATRSRRGLGVIPDARTEARDRRPTTTGGNT